MPINFDLEKIRKEYNCSNYFETGLYDPRGDVSTKKALSCGFDKVFCIEIRNDWVELGYDIFKNDISTGRYNLILDDSTNMKLYLDNDVFNNKTMFFLDAHVDNDNIHNYKKRCPLFDELSAIKSLPRNDNIILIDDLRILNTHFPWGEQMYGDINYIQHIISYIWTINDNYKFSMLNGYIENDVLLAYI